MNMNLLQLNERLIMAYQDWKNVDTSGSKPSKSDYIKALIVIVVFYVVLMVVN